jgi:hypothetical protein
MTGNQPGQYEALPRPALLPNVPLACTIEHLFYIVKGEATAMARKGRTCVVAECDRRAMSGSVVCQEHRQTALGEETEREITLMTRRLTAVSKLEDADERREAARVFRQQVTRGDYAAVFSTKMTTLLEDAGGEIDLKREIGMLRVAMMRLLLEEESPSRMAHAAAKLTFAMGRAMQLQAQWAEAFNEDGRLSDLLNEILIDMEKEGREEHRPWLSGDPSAKTKAEMADLGIRWDSLEGTKYLQLKQERTIKEWEATHGRPYPGSLPPEEPGANYGM